jgi:predicted S18 family serine protease
MSSTYLVRLSYTTVMETQFSGVIKMESQTMNTLTAKSKFKGLKLAALALGASFVLAGCAGNPPSEQYAVTQSAVNSAVSAGGTEYAAVEMKSAQDKLKQADLAMQDQKYDEARRLAEQAEWDARVAERKAQAAKAEKAVQDARQGVNELREEGMRQVQPAPAQ